LPARYLEMQTRRFFEVSPRAPSLFLGRRIYRRGFTDFTREGIFALGSLPLWGNSKCYLRVKILPGVSPNPPFGLILDATVNPRLTRRLIKTVRPDTKNVFINTFSRVNPKRRKHAPKKKQKHGNVTKSTIFFSR